MVSDGIKAARIEAQYSPLINSTSPGLAFQANVLSAVRHTTGWLNPHRGARRPGHRRAGRRRASGRGAQGAPRQAPAAARRDGVQEALAPRRRWHPIGR